jgi:hypothetical protein
MGFVPLSDRYILPLTSAFLLLTVVALAFRASERRGFGPFLLGLAASIAVLHGKFVLESNPVMYFGLAILITASLWNSWPKKKIVCCTEPK